MAQFTNQAQLSYNGAVVNSNVVVGEILEALSAAKNAARETYATNDTVTYTVSAVNTGATAVTGVTVEDDLGGYLFGADTLYPLAYVDGSVLLYVNGVLQPAPTVTDGPPLVFGGITIPAGGNMVLVYEARVTQFAPFGIDASIVNTATLTGNGIPTPITVSETVTPTQAPDLTITKSIEPVPVTDNGTLTYRFVIRNFGNTAADVSDNVSVSDLFDPALDNLTVTFNGATWTEGVEYTYTATSGQFTTTPGQITVPAATYVQDPETGAWSVDPGVATLTVSGTIL
ncbi:MAG: hypothetical protein E7666_07720 [Ruminococcaceae bacterium]|nr:hypothetical protein [Oscillospiraceae bacterium]